VLIVDDERGVRESLRLLLERHFRLQVVGRGEAAIEVLREHAVGVVLLDLAMPGLSGLETLAKIRELDRDVEVVIVTAYGSEKDENEARRLGACAWVTKPLDVTRLIEIVRGAQQSYAHRRGAEPERAAARPGSTA
jgi:DNA-binding NtrC family response regulator